MPSANSVNILDFAKELIIDPLIMKGFWYPFFITVIQLSIVICYGNISFTFYNKIVKRCLILIKKRIYYENNKDKL